MKLDSYRILEEAYNDLKLDHRIPKTFEVKYTGRLRDYGGQIEQHGHHLILKLSRKFYNVGDDIQIGIAQELLCKLFKKKQNTICIDLYNNFVKNLHLAIPKDTIDPELKESFDRVNGRYFLGLVEMPNLKWGRDSVRTFGSYDFKNDTITISKIFQEGTESHIDYIMFHEMLHKQRKFKKSGSKTIYHDAVFKKAEGIFEGGDRIEKELSRVAVKARAKAFFRRK